MNESTVYIGDYGTGKTRDREARLKAEIGKSGRTGRNGYKFHASMNTKGIADLLRGWRRPRRVSELPRTRHWSRPW